MEIDYDFNGSLSLTDVTEDFFFSPSTGLYVFRHPLLVDERVLEAANNLAIKVEASAEKWLVNLKLCYALNILKELGGRAMTLPEFFKIRQDALAAGDRKMLFSLESGEFIELLNTVFVHDQYMVHQPKAECPLDFSGKKIPIQVPKGRYGWFHPDQVDPETGLPTKVSFERKIEDQTFKYWDSHTEIGRQGALMAVRGYVTSVGKISLDLGFPADAISPRLTIRECRESSPSGALAEEVLAEAKIILARYYRELADKTVYNAIPGWCDELLAFVHNRKSILHEAKDLAASVIREDIFDVLGIFRTLAFKTKDPEKDKEIRQACFELSGLGEGALEDTGFFSFVKERGPEMQDALNEKRSIVFVMGHNNPDTDTVVSALAESYRQHLLRGHEATFVPVVPGSKLPLEILELLGEELASFLIYTDSEEYRAASSALRPEWIMVDHNVGNKQSETRAIIDHHYPSHICLRQSIPRRIIFAGSTTALVTLKIIGAGLDLPPKMARILHGATLMDTENRFTGKMTPLDYLVMDALMNSSQVTDESVFYRLLMRRLISCYDARELFDRDYKEDWSFFGFAVAKGINLLAREQGRIIQELFKLAQRNNQSKNLPLTILKMVDYATDAEAIQKERVYPVFADTAAREFREAVTQAIVMVIRHESGEGVQIQIEPDYIQYWGVGTQLSRKKLAPVLELVVNAFNQYFYSPATGLHFKRDFLRKDARLEKIAQKFTLKLDSDENGVVVGNPAQLKFFVQELGFECASPAQFFQAYFDALTARDSRMVQHLTSRNYLETLDAIIEDKKFLVEHPEIFLLEKKFSYVRGERREVKILKGEPGLLDPRKIDPATGLPTEVHDPRQYGTGLWRYWSPDNDCAWVLRSTIFAYDMPALDLKFGFNEVLPRLTIRPCVQVVKYPKVRVYQKKNSIVVDIEE